jgi:hypothetical protein
MCHMRYGRRGRDRYGRALLDSARASWKKLQAMDEAMTINWLTRAFVRMVFYIDVSKMPPEAAQAKIDEVKRAITYQEKQGGDYDRKVLSVLQNVFLGVSYHEHGMNEWDPSLTKVDTIDTSGSGLENLDPLKYYRNRIMMSTRVPKAYFGVEEDINAKATLIREDIRFCNVLRNIQGVLTAGIKHTVMTAAAIQGIPYAEAKGMRVRWFTPGGLDPLEESNRRYNNARADQLYREMEVIDRQWIGQHSLDMTEEEFTVVNARVKADPPRMLEPAANVGADRRGAPAGRDQDE